MRSISYAIVRGAIVLGGSHQIFILIILLLFCVCNKVHLKRLKILFKWCKLDVLFLSYGPLKILENGHFSA